jgi:hypothetical protein
VLGLRPPISAAPGGTIDEAGPCWRQRWKRSPATQLFRLPWRRDPRTTTSARSCSQTARMRSAGSPNSRRRSTSSAASPSSRASWWRSDSASSRLLSASRAAPRSDGLGRRGRDVEQDKVEAESRRQPARDTRSVPRFRRVVDEGDDGSRHPRCVVAGQGSSETVGIGVLRGTHRPRSAASFCCVSAIRGDRRPTMARPASARPTQRRPTPVAHVSADDSAVALAICSSARADAAATQIPPPPPAKPPVPRPAAADVSHRTLWSLP